MNGLVHLVSTAKPQGRSAVLVRIDREFWAGCQIVSDYFTDTVTPGWLNIVPPP